MIEINDKKDCTGCHACKAVCPRKCIQMIPDEEGFLYPQVVKEQCIGCGACVKVCPVLYPSDTQSPLKVYAARNRIESVRMSSSSGGIFTDVTRNWYELAGKKMGIIGMGNIGSKVAKVAEAFGMQVSYFSTSGTSHCKDYPSLPLENLLAESDVVSIHAPLNARTMGLIGEMELSLMKPSAFILNMGRGGIIDETALAAAVDQGRIAGAALDVFVSEPLPADNPLLKVRNADRLRLAPHVAWASVEARERLVGMIAANIADSIVE